MRSLRLFPCAVCFGATDTQTTQAISNSILFLICCTALVLAGLTWMVVRTVKKAASQATSD